jgi:hypothetical protein
MYVLLEIHPMIFVCPDRKSSNQQITPHHKGKTEDRGVNM